MIRVLFAASIASAQYYHDDSVAIYLGSGCFFARQHLIVEEFERSVLKRADSDITAVAGYAGSQMSGSIASGGSLCYHNSQNISDYGLLGHAEVVQLRVPLNSLVDAFRTYFSSFVELSKGKWDREDYYDNGAEYRYLVGFPGGLENQVFVSSLRRANLHNMTLLPGRGSDADTFGTNIVYVMDSNKFMFAQAEVCLQFHDDSQAKYSSAYHSLRNTSMRHGRLVRTGCPRNYICSSASKAAIVV
jgi:hypothetical protein